MTNPNILTLENCPTNLFLLTELNGIHWARYFTESKSTGAAQRAVDDPVFSAFGKCLETGVLASWRRNTEQSKNPAGLATEKELWVFWYEEEQPRIMAEFDSMVGLTRVTSDDKKYFSWEVDGLPYVARTMLFKALHCVMEKSLYISGYHRFGKWFMQLDASIDSSVLPVEEMLRLLHASVPVPGSSSQPGGSLTARDIAVIDSLRLKSNSAFSFSFCVHGDSYVCMVVDVQQSVQPIVRLGSDQVTKNLNVALLPWGVEAKLTGNVALRPNNDLWRDWCLYFPLGQFSKTSEKEPSSVVIEVSICGIVLQWPLSLVALPLPAEWFADRISPRISTARLQRSMYSSRSGVKNGQSGEGQTPCARYLASATLHHACKSPHAVANQRFSDPVSEGVVTLDPSESDCGEVWEYRHPCERNACYGCTSHYSKSEDAALANQKLKKGRSHSKGRTRDVRQTFFKQVYGQRFSSRQKRPVRPAVGSGDPIMLVPFSDVHPASESAAAMGTKSVPAFTAPPGSHSATMMSVPVNSFAHSQHPNSVLPSGVQECESWRQPETPVVADSTDSSQPTATSSESSSCVITPPRAANLATSTVSSMQPGKKQSDTLQVVLPRLTGNERRPITLSQMSLIPAPEEEEEVMGPIGSPAYDGHSGFQSPGSNVPSVKPVFMDNQQLVGESKQFTADAAVPDNFLQDDPSTVTGFTSCMPSTPDVETHPTHPIGMISPPASNEINAAMDSPAPAQQTASMKLGATYKQQQGHLGAPQPSPASVPLPLFHALPTPPSDINHVVYEEPVVSMYDCLSNNEFVSTLPPHSAGQYVNKIQPKHRQRFLETIQGKLPSYKPSASRVDQHKPMFPRMLHRSARLQAVAPYPDPNQQHYQQLHRQDGMPGAQLQQQHSVGRPLNQQLTPVAPGASFRSGNASVEASGLDEGIGLDFALLMSDSVLNHFTDVTFDLCSMCVCSHNVRGWEHGRYVLEPASVTQLQQDPLSQLRCECGYSESRARYMATASGLFHEDMLDITRLYPTNWLQPPRKDTNQCLPQPIIDIVRLQCLSSLVEVDWFDVSHMRPHHVVSSDQDSVRKAQEARFFSISKRSRILNVLRQDASRHVFLLLAPFVDETVLNLPRQPTLSVEERRKRMLGQMRIHEAAVHTKVPAPRHDELDPDIALPDSNVHSFLITLRQVLLPAVVSACGSRCGFDGPLSWSQFARTNRAHGSDGPDAGLPEPLPRLLVTSEREHTAAPPTVARFWDKLLMEPFSGTRDVCYVAVAPDSSGNNFVVDKVRVFFRELSKVYEACRFGRHVPLTNPTTGVLRSGVMRVGPKQVSDVSKSSSSSSQISDWFNMCPKLPFSERLRNYALVCKTLLVSHLCSDTHSNLILLGGGRVCSQSQLGNVMAAGNIAELNTGSMSHGLLSPPHDTGLTGSASNPSLQQQFTNTDDLDVDSSALSNSVIVIYMVNPWPNEPTASIGLLRCYLEVLESLPPSSLSNVHLHIVPLPRVLSSPEPIELRLLALNVYSHMRSASSLPPAVLQQRSITGFDSQSITVRLNMRVPLPELERVDPVLVACQAQAIGQPTPTGPGLTLPGLWHPALCLYDPELLSSRARDLAQFQRDTNVLFVSYCLAPDQDFLVVTCTDVYGRIADSSIINLQVPQRSKCRSGTFIDESIRKLWEYILSVLTLSSTPWRLVIGRLGHLGPMEFRAWGGFLSKTGLKRTSDVLRKRCFQCNNLPASCEHRSVLSACLISFDAEPGVRVLPGANNTKSAGVSSAAGSESTSQVSCSATHIHVFPTSATVQSGGNAGIDAGGDEFELPTDFGEDFSDFDLDKILIEADTGRPGAVAHQAHTSVSEPSSARFAPATGHLADEAINQQPLAVGYYISTCATGPMPHWFWTLCSIGTNGSSSPVHLRAALHIRTCGVHQSDDISSLRHPSTSGPSSSSSVRQHPLESNLTTEVLRYVLEKYNALSWLNLDWRTGDRRSCLPVHVQALCRLYYAVSALL